MTVTLTLQDLLSFILYLLAFGVLIYIVVLVKNVNSVAANIKHLLTANEKEIDTLIKELAQTAENANAISQETKAVVSAVSPDAERLVKNISSISDTLDNTSEKVCHFVGQVNENLNSTTSAIKSINDSIDLITELMAIIKNTIKRFKT